MYSDLAAGKHLVLDHHSVADTYRLRRRVHRPLKEPAAPVLEPERPWEGQRVTPVRVIHDDETGSFRMWYTTHDRRVARQRREAGKGLGANIGPPVPSVLCYAESEDGEEWRRPHLGIYEHEGGDTNICFKGVSRTSVSTIRIWPENPPERRYMLVSLDWFDMGNGGVCLGWSADGIHWSHDERNPVFFGHSDTRNSLLYNPERGVYMLYMRAWHAAAVGWITDWVGGPGRPRDVDREAARAAKERADLIEKQAGKRPEHKNTRRRVAYAESPDLYEWSESQIIMTPDSADPDDFYGLMPFRYADYYLGQLWIYDDNREGTLDVELAYSRDGFDWHRFPGRPKFIPTGEPGEADGYLILPAQGPTETAEGLSFYWTGEDCPHDSSGERRGVMFRGRLRRDGFVSLSADRRQAALVTRPFTLQSDRILLNAATHGGEIVAELVEPDPHEPRGKEIEGYGAAHFDVFTGDETAHALSWRGKSDLSALRGRRLMLRMSLYHAEVYSFSL